MEELRGTCPIPFLSSSSPQAVELTPREECVWAVKGKGLSSKELGTEGPYIDRYFASLGVAHGFIQKCEGLALRGVNVAATMTLGC